MILIFGGAYQGKTAFAKETFGLDDAEIACCTEAGIPADVPAAGIKAIARLEQALLGYIKKDSPVTGNDDPAGETPAAGFLRMYGPQLKDKIVIVTDISQGLVPLDPTERLWREEAGRLTTALAREGEEVYRLFCGIPQRLK